MKPTRTSAATPTLSSVHSDELLPLRVFCQRLGVGKKAWVALARRSFPVIRSGKQVFIDGRGPGLLPRARRAAIRESKRGRSEL